MKFIFKGYTLFILLVILTIVSLFIGVSQLSLIDIFHLSDEQINILFSSRIPRTVSILLSGSSLALSGLIMQQMMQNKFVSPTTAGTMEWAKLGILMSLLFFPNGPILIKLLFAVVLSIVGTFLFVQLINLIRVKDVIFVPLLAFVFANHFTIAGMGKDFSHNLGVSYEKIIKIALFITATLTALVVVTVGTLPFLGLIVPNIISIYRGDHLKNALPHTLMLGAIFVLIADIIGRIIVYPYEINIGLTIGVFGTIIFLILLMKGRKNYANER